MGDAAQAVKGKVRRFPELERIPHGFLVYVNMVHKRGRKGGKEKSDECVSFTFRKYVREKNVHRE